MRWFLGRWVFDVGLSERFHFDDWAYGFASASSKEGGTAAEYESAGFPALARTRLVPSSSPWGYNLLQVFLIVLTAAALIIFVAVVAQGLLGNPEMFIVGDGSSRTLLRWYQARSDVILPRPGCISVSIWWYRRPNRAGLPA